MKTKIKSQRYKDRWNAWLPANTFIFKVNSSSGGILFLISLLFLRALIIYTASPVSINTEATNILIVTSGSCLVNHIITPPIITTINAPINSDRFFSESYGKQ
ncbi:MAG TPA: hypothetical protein VMW76_06135 [Bacteroidales bacterium]|nr:hypothetical protein [Bacteroidales bacterium]